MKLYEGEADLDPKIREKQYLMNQSLWQKLQEEGFGEGCAGRVSGFFNAKTIDHASKLASEYGSQEDWDCDVKKNEDGSLYYIEITTSLSRFSQELFNELSDVFMISAQGAEAEFEGLEVDINSIVNLIKRPWWKFW